ncbi:MAG: hypothetical protein JW819_07805 [Candidatus Krumholzibacteriota bacterium]|nr:hypothetical protein [Candidatus Krumholzibacteriota bacterium]
MTRRATLATLLLVLLVEPAAAADSLALPAGPVLGPDTLSAAHRTGMEAELSLLRAELAMRGMDWHAGETSFLRLTRDERDRRLLRRPWPQPVAAARGAGGERAPEDAPASLDWLERGLVTPVRDQGDCAAGWAYATTACLESAFLLARGFAGLPDFDLSEEQLLTCLAQSGFAGDCDGGWPEDALWFATSVGLVEEGCWPRGAGPRPCAAPCEEPLRRRHRFAESGIVCRAFDLEAVKRALRERGPLVTTMTVHAGFEAYAGGVYRACGPVTGFHALLLAGYDDMRRCFIVKNSWGEGWGLGGWCLVAYDAGCQFGDWTAWVRYDPVGPYAAMAVAGPLALTGEPVRFADRSLPAAAPIVEWEWDFDGDGRPDAAGPGPHEHVFREPGFMSPSLVVRDEEGREDRQVLVTGLEVIFDGPAWVVDAERGSPYGDGSPGDPFLRVQTALNAAADGDTILLRPGRYTGAMNSELAVPAGHVVLRGGGPPEDVILDGEGRARLLVLGPEAGEIEVRGLTFRDGFHPERGGAVLVEGAAPRFVGCRFVDNAVGEDPAAAGAAVWSDGSPRFEDCSFTGQASLGPGGAIQSAGGLLTLAGCGFEENRSATAGGAVAALAGSLTVRDCFFERNEAGRSGGALYLEGVGARLRRVLLAGNRAGTADGPRTAGGGALALGEEARLDLGSSILAGNRGPQGGALLVDGGEADLVHATFWGNTAGEAGGALAALAGTLRLVNSILWGDAAPADVEMHAAPGAVSARHCLVAGGWPGTDILDADPLFADPYGGNFHLDEQSPCLGAGDPAAGAGRDYDGLLRPRPPLSAPDLGASESPLGDSPAFSQATAPASLRFLGVYPNPFNPTATFSFVLPELADVSVLVYLPSGRLVAALAEREPMTAGSHSVSWTAHDAGGQPLASGLFLVRVDARYADGRQESEIHKAMLIK